MLTSYYNLWYEILFTSDDLNGDYLYVSTANKQRHNKHVNVNTLFYIQPSEFSHLLSTLNIHFICLCHKISKPIKCITVTE